MNKLAELLRERLDSEDLSVRDAAKKIGVSHSTVARAANGETVEVDTLVKIANFLGLPLESVLEDDEYPDHMKQLMAILSIEPELIAVLSIIAKRVKIQAIDQTILSEIAAFASYRLQEHEKKALNKKR